MSVLVILLPPRPRGDAEPAAPADYAYVLENGGIKMHGEAHALRDDPRVIESYLGLGSKHQELLST